MIRAKKNNYIKKLNNDLNIISIDNDFLHIIYFKADWCGPCHYLEPVLEDLAYEYENKVIFISVDVDQHRKIADNFNVKHVPSIIIMKNEQEIRRIAGSIDKQDMIEEIENALI